MTGSEHSPEPTPEQLLVEYQAAQTSAEHHDGLIWSISGVVWAASLVLLGILLAQADKPHLKHVVVLFTVVWVVVAVTALWT